MIGELCHFVDWARWLVGTPIRTFSAITLPDGRRYSRDNVATTLTFADGSIANLVYLANGDPSVSKERYEVFCQGAVARIEDFELIELAQAGKTRRFKIPKDKGHRRELQLTVAAMISREAPPIPFDEVVEVTDTNHLDCRNDRQWPAQFLAFDRRCCDASEVSFGCERDGNRLPN